VLRFIVRRVAWTIPVILLVVLIAVSLITVYIFGLDQMFGQFVFWIFG
jgi:preprotein translocase subunit SecE